MSMTDEQIVKALEICNSLSQRCGDGCPYYTVIYKNGKRCSEMMIDDTLDLIKRQQAEIEKLNKVKVFNFTVSGTKEIIPILFSHEKEMKNEAVKEFAEKYKTEVTNRYEDIAYKDLFFGVIDNLVKEVTEKEAVRDDKR